MNQLMTALLVIALMLVFFLLGFECGVESMR